MTEQWQELKETVIEMRDNGGTGTQQEVCKFLINYMEVLEKQMQEPKYCDRNICLRNEYNGIGCDECEVTKSQESNGEAISREWLKTAIHNFYDGLKHTPTEEDIQAYIDVAPSVKPQEPKTGHWIDIMVGDMLAQACDQCNTFYPLSYTGGGHKYCPNCGAKMEGEEKMKREDAIIELKRFSGTTNIRFSANFWEALNIAIQALEQEPKIVPIAEIKFDDDMLHEIVEEAVKNIEIEPKWIPCSERLPEVGSVLVCYESQGGMAQAVSERFKTDTGYRWSALAGIEPIAWMPLPEPYKE
jgi:hypothetical protein